MELNRSFGIGLSAGALLVAIIVVLVWPGAKPKATPNSNEVQLVVRYKLNHNTNKFDFSFEDGVGNPAKVIELKDPNDPLGELARGKPDGKLNLQHGVDGTAFVIAHSHGCLYSCVGGFCGSSC